MISAEAGCWELLIFEKSETTHTSQRLEVEFCAAIQCEKNSKRLLRVIFFHAVYSWHGWPEDAG
jgi:hypothetical protein